MNKLKVTTWLVAVVFSIGLAKAQSVDDAKKLLYYEKYKTATTALQGIVSANPGNAEAAYWLGQAYLRNFENLNLAGAKDVFQKGLTASNGNALLTAAMGQVNLIEGKGQEARNNFEAAIGISKSKDIAVLNAIGAGIVNAQNYLKYKDSTYEPNKDDAAYAVEKLKMATAIKGFNDPEVWVNLGDAYRKLEQDGGNAIKSYQSATQLSPGYAKALLRQGKVYETQGTQQKDLFESFYIQATEKDPNYGPAFYALYNMYANIDGIVNAPKAANYLDKYLALTDDPNSPENRYARASIRFPAGDFQGAIDKAKENITMDGANPYPKNYALIAYSSLRLKDTATALANMDLYFQKQKPELITPKDIQTYALLLLTKPGNEAKASDMINKAIALDKTEAGKVDLLKTMALYYDRQKLYKESGDWYKKVLDVKTNPTKGDISLAGVAYYKGNYYPEAIAAFAVYTSKYPDDIYGFDLKARSERYLDSTLKNGLANADFQKVIDLGEAQWATDSVKVKPNLLRAYKYFIEYSANVLNDRAAALAWCERYLAKEPNDAEVLKYRDAFSGPAPKTTPNRPPATKPGTTTPPKPGTKKKK